MIEFRRITATGYAPKVETTTFTPRAIPPLDAALDHVTKTAPLVGSRRGLLQGLIEAKRNVDEDHAKNAYHVKRSLLEYCNTLTPNPAEATIDLETQRDVWVTKDMYEMYRAAPVEKTDLFRDVMGLGEDGVWLDAGAGYAQAQQDLRAAGAKAKLIACGLKKPQAGQSGCTSADDDASLSSFEAAEGDRFQYVEGRVQLPHIREEIGKVDVITDMIGAFSYSHPTLTLQAYADLLKPGGRLYLQTYAERFEIENPSGGPNLSLPDWLATIPGFELKSVTECTPFGRKPSLAMVLVRTDDEEVTIPPMYTTSWAAPHLPPIRRFALTTD